MGIPPKITNLIRKINCGRNRLV